MPSLPSKPGERLAYWRNQRGLSQKELGKLARTSQQQIDKLEKGQRALKPHWVVIFCGALNIGPSDLIPAPETGNTPQEIALLSIYRRMGPEDRDRLLKMAAALAPLHQ